MSKIFDALRKAERDARILPVVPEPWLEPEASRQPRQSRQARILESEFGYLTNSIQSCFPSSPLGRVIMVVGCAEGEGCTYVAAQLSRALAETAGMPVLYMDGNFHAPGLSNEFKRRPELGLSDVYMNGKPRDLASLMELTDTQQLYVMGTGKTRVSPAAFFGGEQFGGILDSVRRVFRFTVIDAAPVMKHPDAIHLAPRVDGVIVVVRHKRLKREVIRKGIEMIESSNAPILGAVLNRRKFAIPDLIYKIVS